MLHAPNLTPQKSKPKHLKRKDFCGTSFPTENKKLGIGIYHAQFARPQQEDGIGISLLDWKNLPSEKQRRALSLASEIIQECFGETEAGSTASAIIIQKKKNEPEKIVLDCWILSLGDSPGYLADDKEVKRITKLHKPTDEEEEKRIIAAGGKVKGKRLGGDLTVSRAFGNRSLKGLSHDPDITQMTLGLEEKPTFFILASDGLSDLLDENGIFTIIKGNKKRSPGDIISAFDKKLQEKINVWQGSFRQDNTSIIVVPVTDIEIDDAIYISVFDGHSGSEVSSKAAKYFNVVLQEIINILSNEHEEQENAAIKRTVIEKINQLQSTESPEAQETSDRNEEAFQHPDDNTPTSSSLTLKILCACTLACLAIGILTGAIALAGGLVTLGIISKISFFAASTLLMTTLCCTSTNDNSHNTPTAKS